MLHTWTSVHVSEAATEWGSLASASADTLFPVRTGAEFRGGAGILRSEPLLASPRLETSGGGFDAYGPNAAPYALSIIAAGMLQ